LATWWMMNGWTALKYVSKWILQSKDNLLVFSWYQPMETIWWLINSWKRYDVSIPWIPWVINILAEVIQLKSFSSHWDQEDILSMLELTDFKKNAKIMINHWIYKESMKQLREAIRDSKRVDVKPENVLLAKPWEKIVIKL
jgi:predicted metal-dependent RNase